MRYLFLVITLSPQGISHKPFNGWIIWNVGQGQWATYIDNQRCYHFDIGGEGFAKRHLQKVCGRKFNIVYLTHTDRDHSSFYKLLSSLRHCIEKHSFKLFVAKNNLAAARRSTFIPEECPELQTQGLLQIKLRTPFTDNNHQGFVYQFESFLIPGDVSSRSEKYWLNDIKRDSQLILLAHHGSGSSNSLKFLRSQKKIQHIFVSSRKGKYGHPHWSVLKRVEEINRRVISTEIFGTIAIEK